MPIRTCVSPEGQFVYGIHYPSYTVDNLRQRDDIQSLGTFSNGAVNENHSNFPEANVHIHNADMIYEIPNAFPFKGTTYIQKRWADQKKSRLSDFTLKKKISFSWTKTVDHWAKDLSIPDNINEQLFTYLPEPILLTIASTSSDPNDLIQLAKQVCELTFDTHNQPIGLKYQESNGQPVIYQPVVFETLVNNPHLPDNYKIAMVLRPGVQGKSPVVGEYSSANSHVYEYLRANSYIPWGHYAANMAHDTIRYDIESLKMDDIKGMRHLYYQRTYVHLAKQLQIPINAHRKTISYDDLESLRILILKELKELSDPLVFNSNLWGWNFGFDYAPNHYRLHASHQQIHQQYAMIPNKIQTNVNNTCINSYACGDLVTDFITDYHQQYGCSFFDTYEKAIQNNRRIDDPDHGPRELIIYSDEYIMIYVPKAQTSQWEIQIMPTSAVGNILEADQSMRDALDRGIYITSKILSALNARLITHIEYASRFGASSDQRLIIVFLPRMPESPGAFSESQLRWINGHYPEDFAQACRLKLPDILDRSFS